MEKMEVNGTQRWTAKRRLALVLQILKGETSLAEAARAHVVPPKSQATFLSC
jgi:transposase-like protein